MVRSSFVHDGGLCLELQVSEMQADVEHVKEGCLRLLKEAKKYCEQISKMADSNEAFANIVGEFSTNAAGQRPEQSGMFSPPECCSC